MRLASLDVLRKGPGGTPAPLTRFVVMALGLGLGGCAGRATQLVAAGAARGIDPGVLGVAIAGVWDGLIEETLSEGTGAGDTRVDKEEWHLSQDGRHISGYYLSALTFTSGDGRPYLCSRRPSFSALIRFDVTGEIRDGAINLEETVARASEGSCTPGQRALARYDVEVRGDVLTLLANGERRTLFRNLGKPRANDLLAAAAEAGPAAIPSEASPQTNHQSPAMGDTASASASASSPVDVSGVWIWEHQGAIPTGDEKQEREEWHVDQDGARLSGYYDRVVREISTDGHAFKCSMDTEFEIATRYKFRGEVRGNQLMIYESSYEVLEPSACDNGQRRLDAYEGMASGDEVRLVWGVGGQVLRRPRPDVPTQRF